MNGYDRLKELYQNEYPNDPIKKILDYLLNCPNMNDKYLNEEKSIKQMYKFIISKAENYKVDNTAIVEDETVYQWAIDYFNASNEELGLKKNEIPKYQTKTKIEKKEDNNQIQFSLEFV